MPKLESKIRETLKGYFAAGKKPTAEQFAQLIDAFLCLIEDGVRVESDKVAVGKTLEVDGDIRTKGRISGNGAGLTGLDAGQIASGIVPDARLAANVARLNNNDFTTQKINCKGLTVTDGNTSFAFTGWVYEAGIKHVMVELKGFEDRAPQLRFTRDPSNNFVDIGQNNNGNFVINQGGADRLVVQKGGNIGIGATAPSTRLQLGAKVIDDNSFKYDPDALMVVHQTPTSSTALNDPKTVLMLARQGTSAQACGAAAALSLSRFENNGANSRTRLDISLANAAFDLDPSLNPKNTIMTLLSNGNVGIGTTAPSTRLHIGAKVIDDNSFKYDPDALMAVHQTPTSSTALNDPKTVLMLARQGTSAQAYGAAAALSLSRFENNGANSRTRLDISLANAAFDLDPSLNPKNTVMTLLSNGNVGIGTNNPRAPLHVFNTGGKSLFLPLIGPHPSGVYLSKDGANLNPGGASNTTGDNATIAYFAIAGLFDGDIVAQRNVWVGTTLSYDSDGRAKNIAGASNGAADLATLVRLQITDYTWIDPSKDLHRPHKKLIAQEVEQVFPQAVSINPLPQVIPSVYEMAEAVAHDANLATLTVTTKKAHGFQVGDKVDLYADESEMKGITVKDVTSPHQFTVASDQEVKNVFVYGREVNDFRTVDYDAISMLNVSATQELARRVEAQAAAVAARDQSIAALEQRLNEVESRERLCHARLLAIEALLEQALPPRSPNRWVSGPAPCELAVAS